MNATCNYYWRLFATGSCFAFFGLGGLTLSTVVFPALLLTPQRTRAMRARWLIGKSFALFMWTMETLGVLRFEVSGAERLRHCRNTIVLANHPTLIDVIALISLLPTASCVVKQALWRNPFLGGVVRAAGYISNSAPETLIEACASDLAAGNPLIIFPEGTRSQLNKPLHFLRGAAYVVLKSGAQIQPVLIDCTPTTLTKSHRWYQIPSRRCHLRIEVLDACNAQHFGITEEPPALAARRLTHALEAYFTQELARYGTTECTQA